MSTPAPPPYSEADQGKYQYGEGEPGYQAQQPAYPQQYPQQPVMAQPAGVHGQQQNTVLVTVPTVHVSNVVGEMPVQTMCPNCQRTVVTSVQYETGGLTWLIFAILCFVGFWCCAFIPFCVDDCKDAVHTCPSCNVVVGRHRRL